MNRTLLALLALLSAAACAPESQPPPEATPSQNEAQPPVETEARSQMEGVWLFAKPDMPFAGGRFDGIRFNAAGRWQALDVLDGILMPAQSAVTGSTSFTALGSRLQTNLHLDTGSGIPLHVVLSADGQQMSWTTNMEPWEYQLERSSAQMSSPIPPPPFVPKTEAEVLAGVQGVWIFTQRDVTVAGAQCDGIRFDAGGRFEYLDVDENGTIVPALAARTGQLYVHVPSLSGPTAQVGLRFDSGGVFPVWANWSPSNSDQMNWQLYVGPVVTLLRTDAPVGGTVPPAGFVPATLAEGLAAAEGVWLFPQRDMSLGGKKADGIRFSATGRWELLDVLEDGTLVPAQQALSGGTGFVLPAAGLTVQMNLHVDSGGGIPMHTNWSLDRQRMSWSGYNWLGLLKRSSAVVSVPFPPEPFVPSTSAEALATLQSVWLFSQRDTAALGTVCDGVRFDAAGNWQTLDVLDDGRVVVAPAGASGTTSFSFSTPTARTVQMNLHPTPNSGYGMHTHWTENGSRMNWKSYSTEFVLYRTQTGVSGP